MSRQHHMTRRRALFHDLPERMRRARAHAGLTQDALAELVGVARASVSSWESGRRVPYYRAWARLSAWLDETELTMTQATIAPEARVVVDVPATAWRWGPDDVLVLSFATQLTRDQMSRIQEQLARALGAPGESDRKTIVVSGGQATLLRLDEETK